MNDLTWQGQRPRPFLVESTQSWTNVAREARSAVDSARGTLSDSPGFIYFVRAGQTNTVKIGYATDVEKRLSNLQCASHHELRLIGHLPGSRDDEAGWHQRFAKERIRGEWFKLSARLREGINDLALQRCGYVSYIHLSLLTRNAK